MWKALLDPAILAQCIPGCDSLEPTGNDSYQVVMTTGVAAVRGTVSLRDRQEPSSYRLIVEGKGGPGFVRGEVTVTLTEETGKTVVQVAGDGQVGGILVLIGQQVLQPAARQLMNRFVDCLRKKVEETG